MRVFHLLGNLLFTAGLDPVIRSFNLETGEVKQYEGHTSWVLCLQTYVTYDENDKQKTNWLFSGSDDSTIRIWDITSTKCLEKYTYLQFSFEFKSMTIFLFWIGLGFNEVNTIILVERTCLI